MKRNNRRINHRISMCLAVLSVAASLIGSARSPASGQASLVRVVSPADFVLQPIDPVAGTVKVDFEFDPRISYVMLYTGPRDVISGGLANPPFKLPATAKTLTWTPCSAGADKYPNDIMMVYEAHDSAGARIDVGTWNFKMGADTPKPSVHIVSPQNGTLVSPGEAVDIVVSGEESKSATTWQMGLRRLTLVDPALNTQNSPETPSKLCGEKQWTSEHHFRYVVPHDAQPGLLSLTAGAEDWAKNVGFATLDLTCLPAGRTGGVWTVEGRMANPNWESTFVIYAAFSFTFNKYTHAVECGNLSQRYCGTARVTFLPGREKKVNGGWCEVKRVPASRVFKIVAHGIQKGEQLTMLNIQPAEPVPIGYHEDCGEGNILDSAGDLGTTIGSILPEGITIALPLLGGHTTVSKHETNRIGLDLSHKVELYQPRQNR